MLMMNQRRRQHFFGQLEELERERAGDDRRVLDQIGHLEQQAALVVDGAADAPLQALRLRVELAGNLVVPFGALEDDEVLEQPRPILVERPHLDGAAGAPAGRQEAVAVGRPRRSSTSCTCEVCAAGVRAIVNGTTRPP